MSKLLLSLFVILLFAACQNETVPPDIAASDDAVESRAPREKIKVCHYDAENDSWRVMYIPVNAWPAHQAHGDLIGDCLEEETVVICDQVWMVKNLDVTTYRNGDPIPQVTDPAEWETLTTGAWCYYDNDPANGATYGRLYNWYAVNDPRGLAPEGWHIPGDAEWTTLATCLGGEEIAGGPMKSTGTLEDATGLWYQPNLSATNSSGFSGLPGGFRNPDGMYAGVGTSGVWWSSTAQNTPDAWYRTLLYANEYLFNTFIDKRVAMSVRCIRD